MSNYSRFQLNVNNIGNKEQKSHHEIQLYEENQFKGSDFLSEHRQDDSVSDSDQNKRDPSVLSQWTHFMSTNKN